MLKPLSGLRRKAAAVSVSSLAAAIFAVSRSRRPKPVKAGLEDLRPEAVKEIFELANDYHYKSTGAAETYMRELEKENKELMHKLRGRRPKSAAVDMKRLKRLAAEDIFNMVNDYHHKSDGAAEMYMRELENVNEVLRCKLRNRNAV